MKASGLQLFDELILLALVKYLIYVSAGFDTCQTNTNEKPDD